MAESSPTSPKPKKTRRERMSDPPSLSSSSVSLSEELQCCVCLDVFNDPVSTPCGHNFCRICLKQCWDNSQIYSCPYCKETFSKRPELKINTTLREITLIFKEKFSLRRSEVLCDVCDEKKLKALKSCLMCQTSYCQTHLDLHEKVTLKKHKLLDPVENIKDYICEKHERPLELFCRDDQTCVCVFCTDGDHKNHNTVPLEEERKVKKTQLMKTQTDIQQMIQKRIKKIQDIKHSAELRKRSREQEKAASVELFSDLIRSIERCQTELLEMMEKEQKQDEDLIKDLEQEITLLKWRDSELLEKITDSEDHLQLIQIDPSSLYRPLDMKNWSEISTKSHVSVGTLERALTQLQETLSEKLTQTGGRLKTRSTADVADTFNVSQHQVQRIKKRFEETGDVFEKPRSGRSRKTTAREDQQIVGFVSKWPPWLNQCPEASTKQKTIEKLCGICQGPQPAKRMDTGKAEVLMKMQQYAVNVTLDPDTASPYIILSEYRKQVRHGDIKHKLPENPERFDPCPCVLGKEGFTSGRFYFEVQVNDKTEWDLGVARESVNRKGAIKATPEDGFWTVCLRNENEYKAWTGPSVSLCLKVKPQKVGVFVDYEEGLVCFYDVESRSHIYSFTAQTFTEKLFPYFSSGVNDEGKNSAPLIISPVHYNK
ncbi:zinc finger protein RFP-like [Misgurnus anguillicaudatus]|uniref:zinc finger protein RFP-like n=1 Tax=Misgurnus anguillicaudatus TaxID=75329 RepID=UPI003CCFB0BB